MQLTNVSEIKVETEMRLLSVKSDLEMQLSNQKVRHVCLVGCYQEHDHASLRNIQGAPEHR